MTTDLETRLVWVAVDHWDTDNPHTHVVLRGRAANGQNLVIAPDYMAHGMRYRAAELATEWLGARTELEIRQGLSREVDQERLTSLDRTLLRSRLQRLETMGLAQRTGPHHWRLSPRLEPTLTALGERGDVLLAMQKELRGQPREYMLATENLTVSVIGRIAGKGLADELNDRDYLVVDGVDDLTLVGRMLCYGAVASAAFQ